MHPVESRTFSWAGQEREIDLCPTDLKEVSHMFETLLEKGRRPERKTTRATTRKAPYSGDTRFNEWYNQSTGMFECPAVLTDGEREHKCSRKFTTANGLAVHHARTHGSNL
jgi:hypothetical protein